MAYTYSKLASVTAPGGTAIISFTNIPQNYTDLIFKISARASTDTQSAPTLMTINGNTSLLSARRGSGTVSQNGTGVTGISGILTTGNDFTANVFGSGEVYIPNYTSANFKTISIDSVNGNVASGAYQAITAVQWASVVAINSVVFTQEVGNTVSGSLFTLYGIKNS